MSRTRTLTSTILSLCLTGSLSGCDDSGGSAGASAGRAGEAGSSAGTSSSGGSSASGGGGQAMARRRRCGIGRSRIRRIGSEAQEQAARTLSGAGGGGTGGASAGGTGGLVSEWKTANLTNYEVVPGSEQRRMHRVQRLYVGGDVRGGRRQTNRTMGDGAQHHRRSPKRLRHLQAEDVAAPYG